MLERHLTNHITTLVNDLLLVVNLGWTMSIQRAMNQIRTRK